MWSKQPDRFPLRTIDVTAELKAMKEQDIKATVLPFLPKGFFWVDVDSVQQSLTRLPWIQSAEIRRVWPDRLEISVQEKTAQARWGEEGVLSTEGVVFYPDVTTLPEKLPRFYGPSDRAKEVLHQYLNLLELLSPIGLTVQSLALSAEGSWRLVLDNGVAIILGKTGLSERMGRFVLAYQGSLQAQIQRIAYIDLRYTNGFAIGWKKSVQ